MDSLILDKTYNLAYSIKNLELYKEIVCLSDRIDRELKDELKSFDDAKELYNEALKYGKYHPSLKEYERNLSEAKAKLYSNNLVIEYNKKYRELNEILDSMFDSIKISISNKFELSNTKKKCGCAK